MKDPALENSPESQGDVNREIGAEKTGDPPAVLPGVPNAPLSVASCPACRGEFAANYGASIQEETCPYCRARVSLRIFPRFDKEPPPEEASGLANGDEATCHFYPDLKAEVVCDECGCFLSRRASIRWGSQQLCLPCLHTLREEKAGTGYRAQLKVWDNRALALLALLPVSLFTVPVAIFWLIRYRKEPVSWVPRSAFRWWLAMISSILILTGWIALIVVWIAMIVREIS